MGELDAPRPVEGNSKDEALNRWVRPEIDDAPLGDMFADSDGEACPISPSKSARRRMRRRRQRDAIRASALEEEQEQESDRKEHGEIGMKAEESPQAILVTTPLH